MKQPSHKKSKALTLLHSELDLTLEELRVIKKRMEEIENFLKDFPKDDPSYALYESQLLSDRIYLDELIQEEEGLRQKIDQEASRTE